MNLALGLSLSSMPFVSGLDPDAKAYINALVAAGATVSGTQRNAINTFVETEKAASRWTSIKRMYFPIWGAAAPNAIDMIGRTSGTWVGGVTHASGYVQGNGTTGYFNTGASPTGVGMSTSTGMLAALIHQADTRTGAFECFIGCNGTANAGLTELRDNNTDQIAGYVGFGGGVGADAPLTGRNGIAVVNRAGSADLKTHRRTSSGFTSSATATGVPAAVTTVNAWCLGRNADGILAFPTNARVGALVLGAGLSHAQVETFTANLKTLFETATGLTLP